MLLVQDFLRTHSNGLAELQQKYAILVKQHGTYPNLTLLKYNQLESPLTEPLVQECRGLILDSDDNWRVISRSFNKFFNSAEGHAAVIDWKTAKVQEKQDGSLCVIYHYDNRWHVQTSGTPDATGDVNGLNLSFADLFWRVFNAQGLPVPEPSSSWGLPSEFSKQLTVIAPYCDPYDLCLAFELTTPYNRVVVPHKDSRLTLIGVRNRVTQEEYPVSQFAHVYPVVKEFPLHSLDQILTAANQLNPMEQEGYVVVDADFNRIKCKSPQYVALHHLKDGFGPRRILEIVRTNEVSEFLTYFPEWKDQFDETKSRYDALVNELEEAYDKISHFSVQKDFALEAVKTRCSGALFALRKGQITSIREFFRDSNIRHLMELLKLKDITVNVE